MTLIEILEKNATLVIKAEPAPGVIDSSWQRGCDELDKHADTVRTALRDQDQTAIEKAKKYTFL